MNKNSISYNRGFTAGIEVYTSNLIKEGYNADNANKNAVKRFRHYSQTGFKKDVKLNNGQREYFEGMADGIEYKYKSAGTPLFETPSLNSKFEQYEQRHNYQQDNYNVDDEIFG